MSRHQRAIPEASAAARLTRTARRRSGSRPGTTVPSALDRSARDVRRVRSGETPGARSTPASGTSTTSSSRSARACVAPGASRTMPSVPRASATRSSPAATGPARSPSTTDATAVPSSGPGTSASAVASSATARSRTEPPAPPSSSGTAIPAEPHLRHRSAVLGEVGGRVVLGSARGLDPAERAGPLPERVSQRDVVVADPDRHVLPPPAGRRIPKTRTCSKHAMRPPGRHTTWSWGQPPRMTSRAGPA